MSVTVLFVRRLGAGLAAVTLAIFFGVGLTDSAALAANAPEGVHSTIKINGRDVETISDNNPLRLSPARGADVSLDVTNSSVKPITITSVRIEGRVIGLSFFSYNTEVDLTVAPAHPEKRAFHLNLSDLGDQANGLLPTTVSLLDPSRKSLQDIKFPVDVRGKVTSIYGEFGFAVVAVTLLWLLSLVFRVATRRLPENRWRRGVQFSAAGFGLGLTLTFTLSTFRTLTPDTSTWAPFVGGCGAAGLIIGYLTPRPRRDDEEEEEEFRDSPALLAGVHQALPAQRPGELPRHQPLEIADDEPRGIVAPQPAAPGRLGDLVPGLGSTTVRPIPEEEAPALQDADDRAAADTIIIDVSDVDISVPRDPSSTTIHLSPEDVRPLSPADSHDPGPGRS